MLTILDTKVSRPMPKSRRATGYSLPPVATSGFKTCILNAVTAFLAQMLEGREQTMRLKPESRSYIFYIIFNQFKTTNFPAHLPTVTLPTSLWAK
jgi:hypothetical protein